MAPRTVGLGPSSYQGGYQQTGSMPNGVGSVVGVATGHGGTPEGRALILLVLVELLLTGWLRVVFRRSHGG